FICVLRDARNTTANSPIAISPVIRSRTPRVGAPVEMMGRVVSSDVFSGVRTTLAFGTTLFAFVATGAAGARLVCVGVLSCGAGILPALSTLLGTVLSTIVA